VDHRADIYSLGVMLYEMLCGQVPQGIFDPPSQRVEVDERVDQVVIRAMQQEPDRRYPNTAEMRSAVENIRQTPLPKLASAAGGKKAAGSPAAAKKPDTSPAAASTGMQEKHLTPWLAGIAAVCALVAVSVVIIQMKQSSQPTAGIMVPPPAPELAPMKSATSPPVAETASEKPAPLTAKADAIASPSEQPVVKAEPPPNPTTPPTGEPPVPLAPPPSEPPVAVATLPGPPKVAQIVPPPVATSSLEPASRPPIQSQAPPASPDAPAPEAPDAAADWHSYVSRGDALMQQRQRDDALEAYLNAFDLATDGRPIAAADIAQLCKKLANFQMSFGSLAEARQTLDRGRQTLRHMAAGKEAGDRQKYLEQIENTLRTLPRE
jgi:serine/threonine protein kinase